MSSSSSEHGDTALFLDSEKPFASPISSSPLTLFTWAAHRFRRVCDTLADPPRSLPFHQTETPRQVHARASPEYVPISSTTWLDGVRGLASLFVYIRHFASATHPNLQIGYGRDDENRYLIQLPFIRLLVGGPAMVALFFIISGYALSWAPLRTMHYESSSAGLKRLSSAIFRRAIRLFLPGIASTFIVMLCISAGLYDAGSKAINLEDMPGFQEPGPPMLRQDPFIVQFKDWLRCTWGWLNIWQLTSHPYDVHTWTLPVEFSCSMMLFLVMVSLSRCTPYVRLGLLASCVLYCHLKDNWTSWLFFTGSALAQLKIIQGEMPEDLVEVQLPTSDTNLGILQSNERFSIRNGDFARISLFLAGLYLLSAPDYGNCKLQRT